MSTKPGMMTMAAAGLIVALAGCGSSGTTAGSDATGAASQTSSSPATPEPGASTSPDSGAAAPALITIKDFKYTLPASVAPGAKVMVKNEDSQNHTVTSSPKGAFDVNVAGGGGTATFTAPTKPGTYNLICTFHANMMGALVVK